MNRKIDLRNISFRLLALVLVIAIVPIVYLNYSNDQVLTRDKYDQFGDKINDVSLMVGQVYNSKMASDRMIALRLSQETGIADGILRANTAQVRQIEERYTGDTIAGTSGPSPDNGSFLAAQAQGSKPASDSDNWSHVITPDASFFRNNPVQYVITAMDRNGTVFPGAPDGWQADPVTEGLLRDALNGTEYSVTEVLPVMAVPSGNFSEPYNDTAHNSMLAIVSVEPVMDDNETIIGAVSVAEILDNGTDIVDTITANTGAYCAIFQGTACIATTLQDSAGRYLVGASAPDDVSAQVLSGNKTVEGIYAIDNLTLYARYEPLKNADNVTVGMLFAGYDAGPGLGQLAQMRWQAAVTGIVASIFSIVIGYIVVDTITRPIRRIVTIADRIAAGDLDTPVETGSSGGEIGELSAAIKVMVGKMVTDIREHISFNQSVLDSITDPMVVVDNDSRITFFNEPAAWLTDIAAGAAMGRRLQEVVRLEPGQEPMDKILESREGVRGFERAVLAGDDELKIMYGTSAPVRNAAGEAIGKVILLHDVTKERKAEEEVRDSLQEKEILLKEIHHRVKNNLQIISSLLSLQSGYIKDKQTLMLFKEGQDRVKSMALIHEKLYQSRDLARINFGDYVRNLAGYLVRSYATGGSVVKLTVQADDVSLEIDNAIPCGLIINEIVTNSLKYAFPGGRPGEIRIELVRTGDPEGNEYRLTVADDGVGLPPDFDIRSTSSLGLQLVTMLTEQIHGEVQVSGEHGTTYVITFRDTRSRRGDPAPQDSPGWR